MAKIPTIQPGTTQLSNPRISRGSPEAMQPSPIGVGKGLQDVGGAAADVALAFRKKLDDTRTFAENAKANTYKTEYMANLRLAESQKRNVDGSPLTDTNISGFTEDLSTGKENLRNIYTTQEDLTIAQANWDQDSIILSNDVIKERYKNLAIVGDVNTRTAIDKLTQSYAAGNDKALTEVDALIKEAVANNIYDEKQAYTLGINATKKAKSDRFLFDLASNFKVVEPKLGKNTYGFDVEELKNANSVYDTEKYKIWNDKQEELDALYFNESLTDDLVKSYVKEKLISPEMGTAWKKAIRAQEAEKVDAFEYTSLLERAKEVSRIGGWIKNEAEMTELFKQATLLRKDVLEARGRRRITKDEGADILTKLGNRFTKFAPYREGITQLQQFADRNYTPKEKYEVKRILYEEFMARVDKGQDPVQAIYEVKSMLYPGYKLEDLELTAKENGLTTNQVYKILLNEKK